MYWTDKNFSGRNCKRAGKNLPIYKLKITETGKLLDSLFVL